MASATRLRSVVSASTASGWLAAIDAHPAWRHRSFGASGDFNAHSSSLPVGAVASLDLAAIARSLVDGDVGALCHAHLGTELVCDVDRCWVRRQYSPRRYPPGHAPHSWHQDGALGFDFLDASATTTGAALLSMLTCWIALTPCGIDAPGLELVDREIDTLLPLAALADEAVRARHREREFLRPALQPGDALAFNGGVLHRTHVRPDMERERTSLELRFFAAGRIPDRLRHDRFLHLTPTPEICR